VTPFIIYIIPHLEFAEIKGKLQQFKQMSEERSNRLPVNL